MGGGGVEYTGRGRVEGVTTLSSSPGLDHLKGVGKPQVLVTHRASNAALTQQDWEPALHFMGSEDVVLG